MSTSGLRIGLVGLDTSHAIGMTKLLNDPNHPDHVAGGRVVVAYPGGSPDFEWSHSRVQGFTDELRDKYDVWMVDSPEAVAEAADLVFITSVDGRVHLPQFERIVRFKKPTFIDKPFALNIADARKIFDLADRFGVPVMSSSSLRYCDVIRSAVGESRDGILGCDAYCPTAEEPTQQGLFWYGIHGMEMIVAAMGVGCKEVRAYRNESTDLIAMIWSDGRVASLRGFRDGFSSYGITVHRKEDARTADLSQSKRFYLAGLVKAILGSLPSGKSDISAAETLEIIQVIEAANQSRDFDKPVTLR